MDCVLQDCGMGGLCTGGRGGGGFQNDAGPYIAVASRGWIKNGRKGTRKWVKEEIGCLFVGSYTVIAGHQNRHAVLIF